MYGRGFDRGMDVVIKKERDRMRSIHLQNLSTIKNGDGHYALKHR